MNRISTNAMQLMAMLSLTVTAANAATPEMAPKLPSPATIAAQAMMRASLPPDNGQDEDFAHRGFIATPKDPLIKRQDGKVVWNTEQLDWVKGEPPASVNPSLWRHTKLLAVHGLFKVSDGVWQVRGIDAANMLVVSGKTGWIIIDPLMSIETATVAMNLVKEHLGDRPVTGVIYGHSHPDHFGGVRAVITPGTNPPIVAPDKLVEESVSENVIAGNAMARRSAYQFGIELQHGPQGYVGSGIVESSAIGSTVTLIKPTDLIRKTGETRVIDGVTFEFQMVPETEAPAEMNFFLPEQRTLYVSEDTTCTMHNVQTPRGALVRDTLKWAGYITEDLNLYGDRVESLVTGHCWPRFGNDVIRNYLGLQRDNYKFIHDQTVRLLNSGEAPSEIAEELKRPAAIANEWSNRGYYGTVRHNAKGVYQRYIGWWDGNPAHFNMHPPVEQGKLYVRAMGGVSGVLREAKRAMKEGDYRWSAEILNHAVFADPANKSARALLADSYEQLGYQAESAIWRNIYLTGALELRGGAPDHLSMASPDMVAAMPTSSLLDLLATRMVPEKIGDRVMTVVVDMTDANEKSLLSLRNSVLVSQVGKSIADPTVTVSGTHAMLLALFVRKMPLDKMEAGGLKVTGDHDALVALLDSIQPPPADYPIVTP